MLVLVYSHIVPSHVKFRTWLLWLLWSFWYLHFIRSWQPSMSFSLELTASKAWTHNHT